MSRKPGRLPEETKKELLEAATAEFAVYGFQKASLRHICERAGTTTGALYTYFRDKDELFFNVIDPVMRYVFFVLEAHYSKELTNPFVDIKEDEVEDLRATQTIVDYYFRHKTLCNILLNHREHPVVEEFFDKVMKTMDQQTVLLFKKGRENLGVRNRSEIDPVTVHWFSHMQVEALLTIISHSSNLELVQMCLRNMLRFMEAGLLELLRG